ncbi:universal stress protein [Anaerovorax odorimutans]|uniref:Universal stress protein n=1 Tax=Anaerovorax odorimutans TaxID=109327 RepID=A0ABT1RQ18_9FIRM|nr:universal stress protein [Anaerovorax odorimutans]MCQ4637254.1 universal stress protein [Anaerovorax odorimutans]
MKRLLLPIDGSERCFQAAEQVRRLYRKEDVEIILMTVRSDCEFVSEEAELEKIKEQSMGIFTNAEEILQGYRVKKIVDFGHIGNTILKHMEEDNITAVVMTRSTREGYIQKLGSVTSYVLKYARCLVIIVPEVERHICKEHSATVYLSGQFCKGADSCLLPSAAGTCVYRIEVLKGRVRLNHAAYNPDGGTWTMEPGNHQKAHYNISAGESREIELFVGVNFGQEDRIDLVNPRPFDPAVIRYEYEEPKEERGNR